MAFQPQHYILQLRLLPIGGMDFFRCPGADAGNLPEPPGLIGDDFQCLLPELRHQPPGHGRAHPFDDPGGQKPLDSVAVRGSDDAEALSLELPAKAGMDCPAAKENHLLSEGRRRAGQSGGGIEGFSLKPEDGESLVPALPDNPADCSGNFFPLHANPSFSFSFR